MEMGRKRGGRKGGESRRKGRKREGKGKDMGVGTPGDAQGTPRGRPGDAQGTPRDAQGKPPGSPKRNRSMTCLTHRMCAGRCVADQRSVADARALEFVQVAPTLLHLILEHVLKAIRSST